MVFGFVLVVMTSLDLAWLGGQHTDEKIVFRAISVHPMLPPPSYHVSEASTSYNVGDTLRAQQNLWLEVCEGIIPLL